MMRQGQMQMSREREQRTGAYELVDSSNKWNFFLGQLFVQGLDVQHWFG